MIKAVEQLCPDWAYDPVGFISFFWPHITLYGPQVEILESLRDNDETIVPAGNMLGKDFIAGLAILWFFCSRTPARILTTSVDSDQLEGVLWGEMRRFIKEAVHPLPILYNHQHIRKVIDGAGNLCPQSEIIGRVAKKGEGFLGRHLDRGSPPLPRCLAVFDEASSIDDTNYNATDTWTHRKLVIGNPYPCTNFFYRKVKEGSKPHAKYPDRFYHKIIQIRAVDSPNVIIGKWAEENGLPEPGNIIPGVMPYDDYIKRLHTWDEMRKSIGLYAEFYEGAEVKLYPPAWLNAAGEIVIPTTKGIRVLACDGAEGGDDTVWTVVDDNGILEILAIKTPDTNKIHDTTLNLLTKWGIEPNDVWFDAGGGGTHQANFLRRSKGTGAGTFNTISFGETASDPNRFRRMRTSRQKAAAAEHTVSYKNRRAEMYGLVRELLDPGVSDRGFGIPFGDAKLPDCPYMELRRQMALMPFQLDGEGKMWLPPKRRKDRNSDELTLTEIIGRSPDHADSLVMAVYGLYNRRSKVIVGRTS